LVLGCAVLAFWLSHHRTERAHAKTEESETNEREGYPDDPAPDLRISGDREQRFQVIVSTFSEVRDASADNSTGLQDASFKSRKPDANPEIVDAPDQRSFTSTAWWPILRKSIGLLSSLLCSHSLGGPSLTPFAAMIANASQARRRNRGCCESG
jgi:hypothetical protein